MARYTLIIILVGTSLLLVQIILISFKGPILLANSVFVQVSIRIESLTSCVVQLGVTTIAIAIAIAIAIVICIMITIAS